MFFPDTVSGSADNLKNDISIPENINKKVLSKKSLVIIGIVAILLLAVIIIFASTSLNTNEQLFLKNAKYLKAHLKDPDSMKLQDNCCMLISDDGTSWSFIDYTAKNGFGGTTRNTAVFHDDVYVMMAEDEADESHSDYLLELVAKVVIADLHLGDLNGDYGAYKKYNIAITKIQSKL